MHVYLSYNSPEIKLIVSDSNGYGITLYGNRRTSQRAASAVVKLAFDVSATNDDHKYLPTANISSTRLSKTAISGSRSRVSKLSVTLPAPERESSLMSSLRKESKSYTTKLSRSLVSVESLNAGRYVYMYTSYLLCYYFYYYYYIDYKLI